ncbi:hypothetical protein MTBSS4_10245 [Magnetospirillum sp. SS-4]|nr:hypothetical protein MTBSS4_10245 [Magnetospirillum sp. SS-4]
MPPHLDAHAPLAHVPRLSQGRSAGHRIAGGAPDQSAVGGGVGKGALAHRGGRRQGGQAPAAPFGSRRRAPRGR